MTVRVFTNRRHILCLVLWIFCTHVAIPSWRDLVKQGDLIPSNFGNFYKTCCNTDSKQDMKEPSVFLRLSKLISKISFHIFKELG